MLLICVNYVTTSDPFYITLLLSASVHAIQEELHIFTPID